MTSLTRENYKVATCHPERRHAAKGMCYECYLEKYPKAQRATCHPGRIARFRGLCRSCYDKDLKTRNPEYAQRQKENHARWASLHRDRRKEWEHKHNRLERVRNRDAAADRERLLAGFGLSWEDERHMLERQGYACGICGSQPSRRFFDLDHDHATGKVRGLLCHRCNKGLGLIGDTEDAVRRALNYLQCTRVED